MLTTDPSGLRKVAAKDFVDKMDATKDLAGVVSWDDNIDFTYPLSSDFPSVKYWIDQVDSNGLTNLNAGLNAAIGLLDSGKQAGSSRVIVFLSNGIGTYTYAGDGGPAADADVKGYVIYTIGLSELTWEDALTDIADATGGKFYPAPTAENLQAIFDDIYVEVTGKAYIANVAPTATFNAETPVNEGDSFNLSLTSPFDPSGADTAAGFEYAFDCGDGAGYGAWSSTSTASCPTDDNGLRAVRGKIRDKDGGVTEYARYELVQDPGITWDDAKAAAEAMSYPDCDVHLVTITSEEEQDALYSLFGAGLAEKWYGGFDTTENSPSEGWEWVTGEPWVYTNWYIGEPNNGFPNQSYLQGWPALGPDSGKYWDDNGWPSWGGQTSGYVVENECGVTVTINNVAPIATFNAPTFVIAGDDFDLSLTDPYDPSPVDTAAGFEYDFDCGSGYDGWTLGDNDETCSTDPDEVGDRTVRGKIQDKDGGVTEYTATVTVLPPSAATNSSLCYYDFDDEADGQQFRLIFTPDMQNWPQYKLPASNPGQFFYNVFYVGDGPASFDITIPEPFEFKGANPVHVYTDVGVVEVDGFKCFEPDYGSEVYAGTLEDLPSVLPGGFLYVAIHLDYGLKGTTGYVPNFNNDALNADETEVLIPNYNDYIFSVTGSQIDSQTIQNSNDFKKIPGFGGLILNGVGDPLPLQTVNIYLADELFDTVQTDGDGWYMLVYKHKGKPVDFKVEWVEGSKELTGTLKANKFVEASFSLP
jgi:hypothetical protein